MGAVPVFASAGEALEVARAALGYVAAADAAGLSSKEQAGCLRQLERVTSLVAAARVPVLGAFSAGKGYSADADYSPRAWLIHKTGITRGAAVSYTAWEKRAGRHPRVFAVLAGDGEVSESFARTICVWTDKLPAGLRDAADGILTGAAVSGLDLRDLAVLATGAAPAGSRTASPSTARTACQAGIQAVSRTAMVRAVRPAGVSIRTDRRMGCSRTGR